MNRLRNNEILPLQVLFLGAAAGAVRALLYLTARDSRGLLVRNHPLAIALWVICAAAAVLILLRCRRQKGSNLYSENFASGVLPAAGCWVFAAGIGVTLVSGTDMGTSLLLNLGLWRVLGILAAAGLVWAGADRLRGRVPSVLTYTALTLYLALHMVSRYQPWSGSPQLQNWVFSLAAMVALTLCAYHHSAFCAGLGKRRMLLASGLIGIFACCAALPRTDCPMLYLCGGIWAYLDLCRVCPVPQGKTEPAPEAGQETE